MSDNKSQETHSSENTEEHHFKGWIPSVTGRLSFSQIGQVTSSRLHNSDYEQSNDGCYLYCYEIRTAKIDDSIFKFKSILKRLFGVNVVFELTGKSEFINHNQPKLIGKVNCYILNKHRWAITPGMLQEHKPTFGLSFVIERNGIVKLHNLIIDNNNLDFEGYDNKHLVKEFVSQCYFFLKDMIHRHRHHSGGHDTFIEPQFDMEGWENKIAYQLGKRIIRRPINGNVESYQSTLGIIAYLRAFQNAVGKEVYYEKNIGFVEASLTAENQKLLFKITSQRWGWSIVIGFYTFLISKFVNWNCGITVATFVSAIIWLVLIIYAMHRTHVYSLGSNSLFIELMRLFSAFRNKGRVLALCLSVSLFFITYLKLTALNS